MSTPAEIVVGGYVGAVLANDARSPATFFESLSFDADAWLADAPEVRLIAELFGTKFVITITERKLSE